MAVKNDLDTVTGLEHELGQTLSGASNLERELFMVRPGQTKSGERDTFVHEIMHMIIAYACLNDLLPHADEEAFVARATPVLTMVIRDNPEMMDYIRA